MSIPTLTTPALGSLTLLLLSLPASAQRAVPADFEDDAKVTRMVERHLDRDGGVPAHLIDVETHEGVVELAGTVPHLRGKERAAEVCGTLKGVRSVVNRIEVVPGTDLSDATLRTSVLAALAADPVAESYELSVLVDDGTVTLSGTVQSSAEKELALAVCKGVVGVTGVDDQIAVLPVDSRPASEIEEEVERRLANDVWIDASGLHVSVSEDGIVTLQGFVPSAGQRARAASRAWVTGVRSVDARNLQVNWQPGVAERREQFSSPTDVQIVGAIRDAFRYDPRVVPFDVDVEVEKGIVTLSGSVGNLAAKHAAEADAHNTCGVWKVDNHLRVRPETSPADAVIVERVRTALKRNPYTDKHEIGVRVDGREVFLHGVVDSEFERYEAADLAAAVQGVVAVSNRLVVTPEARGWHAPDDIEIQRDIEADLSWSPQLDAADVTVNVVAGTATLTGKVDTDFERWTAERIARRNGAERVVNGLTARYGSFDGN